MRPLLLLGPLALAPLGAAPAPPSTPAALGAEATALLQRYLAAPTFNPPGQETLGAQVLGAYLEGVGIPVQILEEHPGRGNLIARLRAEQPEEGPLCLVSHIDVATAEPATWPAGIDPFGGQLDAEGRIWGRGALDMKGLGVMQAVVLAELHRSGAPLRRDVVLVAVADEEVDNTGIQFLLREHWDALGCTHAINEGGLGLRDVVFPGQDLFAVSVGEKGVLWVRMVAEGSPGHGSTPKPDEAPERLLQALDRVRALPAEPSIHPALLELFAAAGRAHGGPEGAVLTRPALARAVLEDRLMDNPLTRAAITDTVHITGLEGALQPNVVPSEAAALLDIRLLPGSTPQAMLDRLEAAIADPQVRLEVLQAAEAAVSPWAGDPVYEALVGAAARSRPGAAAGPAISVGFTDSIYLRAAGVRAYGLMPIVVDAEQAATMHGAGEYITQDQLREGVVVLLEAVREVVLAR